MSVPRAAACVGLALAATAACSSSSSSSKNIALPSLADVTAAPMPIQTAAQAVVRISIAGGQATGSFISPTGLLLTNNHVLGVDICPKEGCYTTLSFMYQRGSPVQAPQTVFVVPLNVDIGSDLAIVQAYTAPGQGQLSTPQYLTLRPLDPAALLGMHINVVGHPEGHLKKWSPGQIVDSDGTWISFDAYGLPGNSGSPVLDDNGEIVGILHRGPTDQDLVSNDGVNEFSIGSASSVIANAMSEGLPAAEWSTMTSTDEATVVEHENVYLNARTADADVGGTMEQVVTALGNACDTGLARTDFASPEDLTAALGPCTEAEGWINCQTDSSPPFSVCPSDVAVWQSRYQKVVSTWLAFNGQLQLGELTFAPAALATTSSDGSSQAAAALTQALTSANTPLDFNVAVYLAAFGVTSYAGQNILAYVQNYAKVPDYALSGTAIAAAMIELYAAGQWTRPQLFDALGSLAQDDTIDIGTKLYVEEVEYQAGELP